MTEQIDPDKVLREMQDLAQGEDTREWPESAKRFRELFVHLDVWLSLRGKLPDEWTTTFYIPSPSTRENVRRRYEPGRIERNRRAMEETARYFGEHRDV